MGYWIRLFSNMLASRVVIVHLAAQPTSDLGLQSQPSMLLNLDVLIRPHNAGLQVQVWLASDQTCQDKYA